MALVLTQYVVSRRVQAAPVDAMAAPMACLLPNAQRNVRSIRTVRKGPARLNHAPLLQTVQLVALHSPRVLALLASDQIYAFHVMWASGKVQWAKLCALSAQPTLPRHQKAACSTHVRVIRAFKASMDPHVPYVDPLLTQYEVNLHVRTVPVAAMEVHLA